MLNELTLISELAGKKLRMPLPVNAGAIITPEQNEFLEGFNYESILEIDEFELHILHPTLPIPVMTKSGKKMFLLRSYADTLKKYLIDNDLFEEE